MIFSKNFLSILSISSVFGMTEIGSSLLRIWKDFILSNLNSEFSYSVCFAYFFISHVGHTMFARRDIKCDTLCKTLI